MMIKGVLRPDRQLKLQYLVDLLLLEWDSNKYENYKWLQMYDILLKYGETFGNYHVSSNYDYHIGDGTTIKLGAWLSQQRYLKKRGKFLAEREQKNYKCTIINNF